VFGTKYTIKKIYTPNSELSISTGVSHSVIWTSCAAASTLRAVLLPTPGGPVISKMEAYRKTLYSFRQGTCYITYNGWMRTSLHKK